jgi:hypothetical protein
MQYDHVDFVTGGEFSPLPPPPPELDDQTYANTGFPKTTWKKVEYADFLVIITIDRCMTIRYKNTAVQCRSANSTVQGNTFY